MKTRRFDFNYKPLQISVSMSVSGSVPGEQNYDADADEYTPDYTLTPLILQPVVGRLDKDEILQPGRVNQYLANVRWYETVGGVRSQIQSSDTDYEMTLGGDNAGRLKVKKNVQPQLPLTLEFRAEYVDTRTNQTYAIIGTYLATCGNSTVHSPLLVLDAADQTVYNPLIDPDAQVVHASLRLGTEECAVSNREFVWEIFREDGTWSEVGTNTVLDYHVTVSSDGASCTVDRSLMGSELNLRCRAKYDRGGSPGDVSLTDASPSKTVSFIRRIPKYEYDIGGVPTDIPSGLLSIAPEARIWDTNGDIDNPEKELLPLWYVATNVASGSLSYKQVGHGVKPVLPTAAMSSTLGGVYGLEVVDCGPTCAWEDGDGELFEDEDGYLILVK